LAIVGRADPYTVTIIPDIRGPVSYNARTGFNVSAGQLTRVEHANVVMTAVSGFSAGASAGRFFVTSGSGNVVTLEVWPGHLPPGPFDGMPLSHWAFKLEAWGH